VLLNEVATYKMAENSEVLTLKKVNSLTDVLGKSHVTTNITKGQSLAEVTSEHSDTTAVP
jgi:hypothetical protein